MSADSSATTGEKQLAPGLYLVATPIGNLEDITLRALRVLRSADRIACEDTRQTAKLLHHFDITTPTISYHMHNERARALELVQTLKDGARIAIVSDAGTPGVADPGAQLVTEALAAGVTVFPIPGANAVISALIASGLGTEHFHFSGFLPAKQGQRRSVLEDLRDSATATAQTHIFYEAPHRILETIGDVQDIFGPGQPIVLARELTKVHEEFLRGSAAEVLAALASRPSIRGEMVLLLELSAAAKHEAAELTLAEDVSARMRIEGLSEKDALKQAAKARGIGKSEAYREWQRTRR